MYRGIVRNAAVAAVVIAAAAITACGDKDAEAAGLFNEAQALYESGEYVASVAVLDSLKKAFPTAVEIQRKAMHLRTLDDEQIILVQTAQNDSALAVSESEIARLIGNFTTVKDPDLVEGYTVNNAARKNPLVNRSGIEARIDEHANLYVVSLLNGKKANHEKIEVLNGVEFASTEAVPYNDATNYRFKVDGVNNETVTFRGGKADTLCMFINNNRGAKLKLNYIGGGTVSMPLPAADAKAIADTYEYARALQSNRECQAQKKYLEAKLQITREQQQKTAQE